MLQFYIKTNRTTSALYSIQSRNLVSRNVTDVTRVMLSDLGLAYTGYIHVVIIQICP